MYLLFQVSFSEVSVRLNDLKYTTGKTFLSLFSLQHPSNQGTGGEQVSTVCVMMFSGWNIDVLRKYWLGKMFSYKPQCGSQCESSLSVLPDSCACRPRRLTEDSLPSVCACWSSRWQEDVVRGTGLSAVPQDGNNAGRKLSCRWRPFTVLSL